MSRNDGDGGRDARRVATLVGVVAVVAVLAWVGRPLLHPVVYGLYTTPALVVGSVAGVGGAVALGRVTQLSTRESLQFAVPALLVLSLGTAGVYAPNALGQAMMDAAENRRALPEVDPDHPRIVTRSTANRFAANSLQTSKFRATGSDVTIYENTTYWTRWRRTGPGTGYWRSRPGPSS